MKTIYSILVFFILTSTTAFGQQKEIEKAIKKISENTKELIERPLKVVLLKEGKKKRDTYNELIKSAIESEWTLNDDYSFISYDEYEDLKKEKSSEFSYLIYYPKKTTTTGGNTKYAKTTFREDGLVLIGFNKKGKKIATMPADICFENSCTLADYYFSIQTFQNQLFSLVNAPEGSEKIMKMKEVKAMIAKAEKEQQGNIKKLKDMTLYVNEKSINEKLKTDFKKYYKYDYKIVSFEAIETAVVENDKKIALLYENTISSADTGMPLLSFMDMKKMKSVTLSVKPVGATTSLIDLFSHEISKKDLERLKKVLK